MDAKRTSYFKEYFKNISALILSTLIAALILTAVVANRQYGLIQKILASKPLFSFFSISGIICLTLLIAWCGAQFKSAKFTLSDCLYFSLVFIGIGYFIYTTFVLDKVTQLSVSVSVALIVLGGILMIIRSHVFDLKSTDYHTNKLSTIKNYYSIIVETYSATAIILGAVAIVLISFLGLNFGFTYPLRSQKLSLIVIFILAVPALLYAVVGTLSRKIGLFDAVLLSGLLAFPFVFAMVFTIVKTETRQIFIGGIFVIFIVSLFMRYFRFDVEKTLDNVKGSTNCPITGYFSEVLQNNGFFVSFAVAGLISASALVIFKTSAISYVYYNGQIVLSFKSIIVATFILLAVLPLALGAVSSLISANKRTVVTADRLLLICTLFCIMGYAVYFFHPSPIYLIVLSAFLIYNIILTSVRINAVTKK